MMLDVVLPDLPFGRNDEVVVLLSGLGSTPVMELYVLYDTVEELLGEAGMRVYRPYVGNLFTSLDMMGVTVTLMKVDQDLKELVDLDVDCMGLTQFGR
jgi:phosphoenolpyruvate---glycerone phosphotransferase subunit DhaK